MRRFPCARNHGHDAIAFRQRTKLPFRPRPIRNRISSARLILRSVSSVRGNFSSPDQFADFGFAPFHAARLAFQEYAPRRRAFRFPAKTKTPTIRPRSCHQISGTAACNRSANAPSCRSAHQCQAGRRSNYFYGRCDKRILPARPVSPVARAVPAISNSRASCASRSSDCSGHIRRIQPEQLAHDHFQNRQQHDNWIEVACIRVEPVMAIGPVVRLIFSMRESWMTSRLRSTVRKECRRDCYRRNKLSRPPPRPPTPCR